VVIGKVVGVISDLWKNIGKGLQWAWDHTIGPIIKFIEAGIQHVKDMLNDIGGGIMSVGTGGHIQGGGSVKLRSAAASTSHAAGGSVRDGWFSVGERGPELGYKSGDQVRIFSNSDSQRMGGGDAGVIEMHNYVVVDGKIMQKTVERKQLRAGMRRGTTYQPFARGRS
jgi:hypothetical protein